MSPTFASGPAWVGRVPPIVLDDISRIAAELASRAWAEAGAGNLSILLPERVRPNLVGDTALARPESIPLPLTPLGGRSLVITRTGSRMRDVGAYPPDGLALIEIGPGGDTTWTTGGQPSSELSAHLAVHATLLETHRITGAIVHTHPPSLIALSHIGQNGAALARCQAAPLEACAPPHLAGFLGSLSPEAGLHLPSKMTVLAPEDPGSQALARRTAAAARTHQLLVWPYHGVVAWGSNLTEALDLIECAEKAAEIAVRLLPWIAAAPQSRQERGR
jgi:rhamnulose-1-phosphate aldolase